MNASNTLMSWVLIVVASLFMTPARGQQIDVRVEPQRLFVGDAATLTIVIPNAADDVDSIQLDPVPGLTFQYAGSGRNTSMSFINGRQRVVNELTFNYRVIAAEAGDYEIPAQDVTVGGAAMTTKPVTIQVLDPPSGNSELEAELARDHAYIGEPVRLTLTWVVGESAQQGFQIYSGIEPTAFEDLDHASLQGDVSFSYNNQRAVARQGVTSRSDGRFPIVTIERVLIPQRPGSFELGPARVRYDAVVEQRGFGLFERSVTEPRVVEAMPITIDVLPLPLEGRPDGFNGLVGRSLDVSTSIPVGEANVGDPIELTVRVSADPPIDRVNLPTPERLPGFEDFKMAEAWDVEDSPGARVFRTTIRASRDDIAAVPPVVVSYFNTDRETYESASSDPLPLTVRQTREVTAADAVGGAVSSAPARVIEELGEGAGGALAITVSASALESRRTGLGQMLTRPWLIAAMVLPGALPVAVAIAGRMRQKRDSQWRRRKRALRRALDQLRAGGEPARCVDAAIRTYVAERFDRLQDALTNEDCRALLTQSGTPHAEEAGELLSACARVRFGGDAPQPSLPDARRLLISLERGR